MKKLEIKQMEKIEGGKFWGTGIVTSCVIEPLSACQVCTTCNRDYVFWIASSPYNCSVSAC